MRTLEKRPWSNPTGICSSELAWLTDSACHSHFCWNSYERYICTPLFSPQLPTPPTQATLGARLPGQASIVTRMDVAAGPRTHPFRFFQYMTSGSNNSNDNEDAGNFNPVPSSRTPALAPPHQDGIINGCIKTFSITCRHCRYCTRISLYRTIGRGGAQPHEGQGTANPADPNINANPNNAQNPNIQGISIVDFMARLGRAIGIGDYGAGLGFGFNFDDSGFGKKEDPERARKLVDGLEWRYHTIWIGEAVGKDWRNWKVGWWRGRDKRWGRWLCFGSAEEAVH